MPAPAVIEKEIFATAPPDLLWIDDPGSVPPPPGTTGGLVTLAELHRLRGEEERAEGVLWTVICLEPNHQGAREMLARIYRDRGEEFRARHVERAPGVEPLTITFHMIEPSRRARRAARSRARRAR